MRTGSKITLAISCWWPSAMTKKPILIHASLRNTQEAAIELVKFDEKQMYSKKASHREVE